MHTFENPQNINIASATREYMYKKMNLKISKIDKKWMKKNWNKAFLWKNPSWVTPKLRYGLMNSNLTTFKWNFYSNSLSTLTKQPTFRNATTGSLLKWHLRNKHRNSILMTCYYPDLGSTSDWLKICFNQSETLTSSPSDAS